MTGSATPKPETAKAETPAKASGKIETPAGYTNHHNVRVLGVYRRRQDNLEIAILADKDADGKRTDHRCFVPRTAMSPQVLPDGCVGPKADVIGVAIHHEHAEKALGRLFRPELLRAAPGSKPSLPA